MIWGVVCCVTLPVEGGTATSGSPDQEARYTRVRNRGIAAFRRGDVQEAAQAFQDAYLMRPTDSTAKSWLSLARDEQVRQEAMTRSLEEAECLQAQAGCAALARSVADPVTPQESTTEPGHPAIGWVDEGSAETRSVRPMERGPLGSEGARSPTAHSRREVLTATTRAGFQRLYQEGIGFQPIRGLGLSARTEIFEEPDPVESLVLDAKVLNFSEISQFRRSVLPLFTRSAAGRVVLDYEPLPRLTYEYDARETLHQFQTKFAFKDIDLQTHAVNALYSFPNVPPFGTLTVNPWYKRVLQSSDHDLGAHEHRDELILNLSLQPTQNLEYFFQFDAYDADKTRTLGGSKLKLYKGQVRMRFPGIKLFVIPSYEYSVTDFDPSDDEFTKRDLFVDWGIDLSKRWRASSKEQWIFTELSQAGKTPSNPDTQVFNTVNTLSYEWFKDFDASVGLDYSKAAGMSEFNNVGLRFEVELFKPGVIRTKVGYEWLSYYNISDSLSLIYWKLFVFQ